MNKRLGVRVLTQFNVVRGVELTRHWLHCEQEYNIHKVSPYRNPILDSTMINNYG